MESHSSSEEPQIRWRVRNLADSLRSSGVYVLQSGNNLERCKVLRICEVSIEAHCTRMVKRRKVRRTEQAVRSAYVQHAVNRKAIPRKQGWIKLYDYDNSNNNNTNLLLLC